MVHGEVAQNRSAGAGTANKYNAIVRDIFAIARKRHYELRNPKGHTGAGTAKKI